MKLTFAPKSIKDLIVYGLGQQFKAVTNIRRADLNGEKAWAVLELEGEGQDVESGIAWVTDKAVRVDSVIGDIVED